MKTIEEQLIEGQNRVNSGRYLEAIVFFSKIIERYPSYRAECYYQISRCYLNLDNNYNRAESWLLRTLEADPDHYKALNILTNHYYGTQKGAEYEYRLDMMLRKHGHIGPADVDDVDGWNYYWSINMHRSMHHWNHLDWTHWVIPLLQNQGYKTVLCVGNGIHFGPKVLAFAGFHVTSLDISSVATDCAAKNDITPSILARFRAFEHLSGQEEQLAPYIATAHPVRYVTGSLFDTTVCPGPYDVVITQRTLQLFDKERFSQGVFCLINRLHQRGILLNHSHNSGPPPLEYMTWVAHYNTVVFRRYNEFIQALQENPNQRVAYFNRSSGIG